MLAALLVAFAGALLAPRVARAAPRAAGWALGLLPLALTAYFATRTTEVARGDVLREALSWAPELGLDLSLRLDGLSLLYALLICGTGAVVLVYAGRYLEAHGRGRFSAYVLAFLGSMLGLVLADNLLALFVFWEATSVCSFFLIGFHHERPAARSAALQALLVTSGGGLALLAGFLLLGNAAGTFSIGELLTRGDAVRGHPHYPAALALVLLGGFTKSAQFPFHFWLPNAMEAPTPASAYLHAATMVKAGIYLFARLAPVLGGTPAWQAAVTGAGAVTMLVGAGLALRETDMKRVLAYTTVSALGILTLLLGLGTEAAVQAAVVFLLAHALYKGALFLVAGAVDHECGVRDLSRLGGLARRMPRIAVVAALAGLSMAPLPPLLGFVGKELFYEAVCGAPGFAGLLASVAVVANVFLFVAAMLVAARPFVGRSVATPREAHDPPAAMWAGPLLLGVLGVLVVAMPGLFQKSLLGPAASAVRGAPTDVSLALWHGFTPALAMSVVTVLGGVVLVALVEPVRRIGGRLGPLLAWGPTRAYGAALRALPEAARGVTRFVQSGYLRHYLLVLVLTTVGLVGYTLVSRTRITVPAVRADLKLFDAITGALIVLAALCAVRVRSRLAAVAAMGVVGYGVALVFILFGAPDLALTLFVVETLTVILFVLAFHHLPRFKLRSGRPARVRDALVAGAAGLLMTLLVLEALAVQLAPPISSYHAAESLTRAHGRNVVNVILVDFRALDTLGEITVLAVAGLAVHALLKLRPRKGGSG